MSQNLAILYTLTPDTVTCVTCSLVCIIHVFQSQTHLGSMFINKHPSTVIYCNDKNVLWI